MIFKHDNKTYKFNPREVLLLLNNYYRASEYYIDVPVTDEELAKYLETESAKLAILNEPEALKALYATVETQKIVQETIEMRIFWFKEDPDLKMQVTLVCNNPAVVPAGACTLVNNPVPRINGAPTYFDHLRDTDFLRSIENNNVEVAGLSQSDQTSVYEITEMSKREPGGDLAAQYIDYGHIMLLCRGVEWGQRSDEAFGIYYSEEQLKKLAGYCFMGGADMYASEENVCLQDKVLSHVFVDKRLRGNGYGSAMIKEVCERFSDVNIWIDVLVTDAIPFYEKLGFTTDTGNSFDMVKWRTRK